MVEAQAIDVVFRTPRACPVAFAERVELLAEAVERVTLCILQTSEQSGTRDGHGYISY